MLAAIAFLITQGPSDEPKDMAGHIAVRIGDQVVIAGESWPLGVGHTWIYGLKTKLWRVGKSMPYPRSFASAVEWKSKVLVMGGLDSKGVHSDRIDAYDVASDRWTEFGKLPNPMTRTAAVRWNDSIYLTGGFNGSSDRDAHNSSSSWRYSGEPGVWKQITPMPEAKHGHNLVEFQGKIWAIGGSGNLIEPEGSVASLEPKTGLWNLASRFPGTRIFGGAGVFGNDLVLFGALKGSDHPLRWTKSGWKPLNMPELNRRRFAFVIYEGRVLIFGGEPSEPFLIEFAPKLPSTEPAVDR